MENEGFDLFGNPVRPGKGGRGRPPYEATERDRNRVKLLLAVGWSNQRIANALAISLATLKRYFRAELAVREQMRDRLEARQLEMAAELASEGNVGAMRELDRLVEKQGRKLAEMRVRADAESEADVVRGYRYVGKKEQARQHAEAVTNGDGESDWGGLLKPGLYDG